MIILLQLNQYNFVMKWLTQHIPRVEQLWRFTDKAYQQTKHPYQGLRVQRLVWNNNHIVHHQWLGSEVKWKWRITEKLIHVNVNNCSKLQNKLDKFNRNTISFSQQFMRCTIQTTFYP